MLRPQPPDRPRPLGCWKMAIAKATELVHADGFVHLVKMVLVDNYVSTEDVHGYLKSVDIVLVLKSNERSSGILLAECSLNKPILANGSTSM